MEVDALLMVHCERKIILKYFLVLCWVLCLNLQFVFCFNFKPDDLHDDDHHHHHLHHHHGHDHHHHEDDDDDDDDDDDIIIIFIYFVYIHFFLAKF